MRTESLQNQQKLGHGWAIAGVVADVAEENPAVFIDQQRRRAEREFPEFIGATDAEGVAYGQIGIGNDRKRVDTDLVRRFVGDNHQIGAKRFDSIERRCELAEVAPAGIAPMPAFENQQEHGARLRATELAVEVGGIT
jgi:hypothetical protein